MTPEDFHDVFHVVFPDGAGGFVYSGYTLAHPGRLCDGPLGDMVFGQDLAGFLIVSQCWEMRALGLDLHGEMPDHVRRFEIRSHGWLVERCPGWAPVLERQAEVALEDDEGRTWNHGP